MQGRFKMEYRLFTIVRYNYNYRDYNIFYLRSQLSVCLCVSRVRAYLTTNQQLYSCSHNDFEEGYVLQILQ